MQKGKKMKEKSATLFIIASLLIYFLFLNNFNIKNSWADDEEIIATIDEQKITKNEYIKLESVFYIRRPDEKERRDFLNKVINASLIAPQAKTIELNNELLQKVKITKNNLLFWGLRNKIKEQIDLGSFSKYLGQKVRFREIVVQCRSEAEQIYTDIMNGQDFEILAREKSINKYSKDGGDVGFIAFNSQEFSEEVKKTIFELEDNQISEMLKSLEGYAIFKAIERKALTDQEKELQKESLLQSLAYAEWQRLGDELRSQARIKILSNNILKILKTKDFREAAQIELISIDGLIIKLRDILNTFLTHDFFDIHRCGQFLDHDLLNTLIEKKILHVLMVGEARRMGVDSVPEIKNTIKRYEEWQIASKYIQEVVLKDVTCTEKEIKKFYEGNKNNPLYKNIKESARVRRIMVEQECIAKKILEQLKKGADFSEMAQKYSVLINHPIGGDLGYLERGCSNEKIKITMRKKYDKTRTLPLEEEEERVIFSLSKGEVSDIIKVSVGNYLFYSIIKVEDKIEKGANTYNEIKAFLKNELLKKKVEEKYNDFITQIKSKANISIKL